MSRRYNYGLPVLVFLLIAALLQSVPALGKVAPDLSTAMIEVAHLSLEGG